MTSTPFLVTTGPSGRSWRVWTWGFAFATVRVSQ